MRTFAALCLLVLAGFALTGCHDGYSTVSYGYSSGHHHHRQRHYDYDCGPRYYRHRPHCDY